ncbi:MAG: hypothetical protein N2B03_00575 [Boseongicola sp.]
MIDNDFCKLWCYSRYQAGFQVVLFAVTKSSISTGLKYTVFHGANIRGYWFRNFQNRGHDFFAHGKVAAVTQLQVDGAVAVRIGPDLWLNAGLVRQRCREFAVQAQEFSVELEESVAAIDGRFKRVQPKLEFGGNTEIAAAAANSPELVGILIGAGPHYLAACRNDIRGQQIINGQTHESIGATVAAAECEATNTGMGDDTGCRSQVMRLCRHVDVSEQCTAVDPDGSIVDIHIGGVHL